MSFYGNIFYELTNAFASVLVKNSGKDGKSFTAISNEPTEVEAIGLGGKLTLDTGNKWIKLSGDPVKVGCAIEHAAADPEDKSQNLAGLTKSADELAGATELSPGDYVQTVKVFYDAAGHVTGVEPISFRLPVSKTEADLLELEKRMDVIEESDKTQTEEVEAVQQNFETLKNQTESELKTANSNISTNTDDIAKIRGELGTIAYVSGDSGATFAKVIGSVASPFEALDANSIASALTKLTDRNTDVSNTVNAQATAMAVVVDNICKSLNSQLADICEKINTAHPDDAQVSFKINYDDLWKVNGTT